MNGRHALAGLPGIAAGAALTASKPARAASNGKGPTTAATVEQIYKLCSGEARVDDRSIYSPGVHVGELVSLSCNAYLIKRADGWTLWDTGMEDSLAELPEGRIIAHDIRGIAKRTIAGQLKEIGIAPKDVSTLILSHAHFDHAGNCRLFCSRTRAGSSKKPSATRCSATTPTVSASCRFSMTACAGILPRWSRATTTCSARTRCR